MHTLHQLPCHSCWSRCWSARVLLNILSRVFLTPKSSARVYTNYVRINIRLSCNNFKSLSLIISHGLSHSNCVLICTNCRWMHKALLIFNYNWIPVSYHLLVNAVKASALAGRVPRLCNYIHYPEFIHSFVHSKTVLPSRILCKRNSCAFVRTWFPQKISALHTLLSHDLSRYAP